MNEKYGDVCVGLDNKLEEVLQQLGDTAGAAAAYDAYLSAAPHEGLRHRRRVPCARVLEVLAQVRTLRPRRCAHTSHPVAP